MTQHVNDHMMNVVGPAINDGLAAYFRKDAVTDPSVTLGYRFTDATLAPVVGSVTPTFTRASPAMVWSGGILKQVSANVPRFPGATYNGDVYTGKAQGLQIEPPATNLCLQSEDFATTPWDNIGSTDDSNVDTAPDGTLTADRLNVTPAGTTHNIFQPINQIANTVIGLSVYMKDDGAGFGSFALSSGGSGNYAALTVNLSTGVVTDTSVGPNSGTILSLGSQSVGNGWFRVFMKASKNTSGGYFQISAAESGTPNYDPGGRTTYPATEGRDILLWGGQIEVGAVTSYIKTTTVQMERAAEICKTSDVSWFGQGGPGTVYAKASAATGGNDYLFSINNNAFQSRIAVTQGGPGDVNDITAVVVEGGVTDNLPTIDGEFADRASVRLAIAWSDGESVLAAQGLIKAEVSSARPNPTGILTLDIGNRQDELAPWFGIFSEFAYSTVRKPNDELQSITAP